MIKTIEYYVFFHHPFRVDLDYPSILPGVAAFPPATYVLSRVRLFRSRAETPYPAMAGLISGSPPGNFEVKS